MLTSSFTVNAKRIVDLASRTHFAHQRAMKRTERLLASPASSTEKEKAVLMEMRAWSLAQYAEALASLTRCSSDTYVPYWTTRALRHAALHRESYLSMTAELQQI